MCLHSHNSQHFLGPHRSLFANCSNEKYQINQCLHLVETKYDQNVKLGTNTAYDSSSLLCHWFWSFSHPLLLWPPLPHLSSRATLKENWNFNASRSSFDLKVSYVTHITPLQKYRDSLKDICLALFLLLITSFPVDCSWKIACQVSMTQKIITRAALSGANNILSDI